MGESDLQLRPAKKGCKIRWFDGLSGSPGKSQQGPRGFKTARGAPPSSFNPLMVLLAFLLALPWAP